MKTRKAAVRAGKTGYLAAEAGGQRRSWKPEMERMDRREHLYSGDRELRALTKGDEGQKAPHIRNIVFENIESQVSSAIPSPKVTPRRKEDEGWQTRSSTGCAASWTACPSRPSTTRRSGRSPSRAA